MPDIGQSTLPPYVELLIVYPDGHRLFLCRAPLHATPRDYVRGPGQSPECPLCLAVRAAADDAHSGPEAA